MKNKVVDIDTAISKIHSGDTVMIGGFTNAGCPYNLLYALGDKKDEIKDLTIVSEDMSYGSTTYPQGQEILVYNKQVKEVIISFLGKNKRLNEAVDSGEVKLSLFPQGTLIEKIRAAGAGLGGFYTPTGVGTLVEEGKETKIIDGKKYLLELPLKGDVALVKVRKCDTQGNGVFRYSTSTFNIAMATAAKTVIMETEELVDLGEIEPDRVGIPGVFVDYIVECKEVTF